VLTEYPEAAQLFDADSDGAELAEWLDSAAGLLDNYFVLEDPSRLEPAAREERVEIIIDGLRLRGYVDRIDVSPAGDIRIVDYKTGTTPREAFEAKALFQMKFYALVLWRTRGVVPRQLRLMYLADTDTLSYTPDGEELERFERTLKAIWAAIQRATESGDFRPNPGRLCGWCDHQALCPAFGGTPPPFPAGALATIDIDHRSPAPVATA
jgi:putative RecB family exonuclease